MSTKRKSGARASRSSPYEFPAARSQLATSDREPTPGRGARSNSRKTASVAIGKRLRERIAEVREGLPLAEFDEMAGLLGIDRAQLAGILDTSLRTFQRKAETDARLGPAASDRLARIKRIHELATHVLGEPHKASRWLTSASRALGGEMPLQLLDTDMGTQRVQQELREIEYGMPL